jgi:hypothetical protein
MRLRYTYVSGIAYVGGFVLSPVLPRCPNAATNSPSFSLLPITRPLLLPHLRTHRTQYRLTQSISSMLARDFGRGVGWKRGMANGQVRSLVHS